MTVMLFWLQQVAVETGRIALEMAPFVVLGLLVAIGVFAFLPQERIQRWLGRPGLASTVKAAIAGIPLPLCSCGVIPTALSLRRRGASVGATVSFLVSTPETGADSIAVTYGLINPAMTILRPVAALFTAVATGSAAEWLGGRGDGAKNTSTSPCPVCGEDPCGQTHTLRARLAGATRYVVRDFFPDIANWLVLGLLVSGILAATLPVNAFTGSSWLGQFGAVLVLGVPLYICASASTPIAAVLLAKGMTPGTVLVFLLVGPATNAASLLLIGRSLGGRIATVYLTIVIIVSVFFGLIVNMTMLGWDWTPRLAVTSVHESAGLWQWIGLALLAAAILNVWFRQIANRVRRRKPAVAGT
ncbi:MAG: SO_0444 family Cu/Zn efflux transporter [candidate division Zixibacteria bacterium]|nr:SO_0444 family Cu/Zn efflux transporter [candidate division Zixibacteria bacterium]